MAEQPYGSRDPPLFKGAPVRKRLEESLTTSPVASLRASLGLECLPRQQLTASGATKIQISLLVPSHRASDTF
jgi:hypothetical protein